MKIQLTIFFEDPFWVGVFERIYESQIEVVRVPFGGEPRDCEILQFVREHYHQLLFSRPVQLESVVSKKINPKRLQKLVRKEVVSGGIGTKSQEALKKELQVQKVERRERAKIDRDAKKERKFELRQEARKLKHRGR